MGDVVIIFLASLSNVDPPWKQWWVWVEENGSIDTCSGGREEGQQGDVCHGGVSGRGGDVCDLPKALQIREETLGLVTSLGEMERL
ncbi:hypothetical protein VIGAN_01036600 [Vigna angularis var. angularis]|uniref:Uncharacterized protein n=1 Tax=Vigna angularis var. angularis TaxID=157739 RepID=A0A0S3QX69_PHAAN|nr:hypothetical protein VIGAN_01036600 [Vigna angularis var. angularis]